MVEFDMTYYYNFGRTVLSDQAFFWSHVRLGVLSEIEEEIPIRSDCMVDKFKLIVYANAYGVDTFFALRKNGDHSISSTVDDVLTFDVLAGQTGTQTSDFPISYSKSDFICWKFRETVGPLTQIDFEIQCRIRFNKPPAFP